MGKKKAKKKATRRRRVKSAQSQLQATTRKRRKTTRKRVTLATAVERAPKKPRLKKRAKKPKLGASLATWYRYEARQAAIDAENERRLRPYFAKLKAFQATKAAKEQIRQELGSPLTYAEKLAEMGMA